MNLRHILVGTRAHAEIIAALASRHADVECRGALHTDVTADDLAWADVYLGFKRPPGAATMGAVRWVHCTGAGVDSWLAPGALDDAILLTRTPESFGPAIAEWVVARIFAVQQHLTVLAAAQRDHRWTPLDPFPVAGTRALVVGTGDIGRQVATTLAALGVTVTGVSRSGRSAHPAFHAVHPVDVLPDLVGEADWIILALPDTPATRGLVSRAVMERCRGAVLLNAGRGSAVDEDSLVWALENWRLRGAALDVFAVEPLPVSSPLWDHPRVVISPHCSGPTTVQGAVDGFLECLAEIAQGRVPRWVVDRERGY